MKIDFAWLPEKGRRVLPLILVVAEQGGKP